MPPGISFALFLVRECVGPQKADTRARACRGIAGLSCCHHLWLLTDTAQESSFKPDIFEYFLKFRFYFQEWTPPLKNGSVPASHQNLVRLYHQTEDAASEYDVPLCNQSVTAKADCVHQITAHWQVRDTC